MTHTKEELKQMQALPLETKIQMSRQRILEWYDAYDGMVYVSFSGGKDSTVLKHLVETTLAGREREREREYGTERFLRYGVGISRGSPVRPLSA